MKTNNDESTQDGVGTGPYFIDSLPLGTDLLEGRSQEQIAESLSDLIRTNRTENRLIGLDGAWGSGKSNLIKIIEAKLEDTHHVFSYDAWGHQEDLQRRALLEELTANLCDEEIIDPELWNDKLKDLLAKKRETLTKTIPHLSYGVIVTLLIAISTPIAKAIADGAEDQYAKLLITSLPIIIGLGMYVVASFKAGHRLSLNEIYAIYKEKDVIDKTHVTISENEPSVRDFQRWMKDLSNALIEKKLIVVFDNMDRLPPDRVRELWSSIHTFFAEKSFDNIWVLIPFDRDHIAAAFDDNEDVADQFLRKSFSVIYRVAPPVLTDWQKFFELKFRQAFDEHEEEELHIIRRAFDILENQITPRSIIAFINEMVSLRLVVEKDILLRYIALFVLTKKTILKAPVDQILNLEFLQNAAPLFREDEDLPNHIAALVYHVPLSSASQVSLTREIENSMRDKNGSRFNELAQQKHFVDILEQVVAADNLDIPSSATTLEMLDHENMKFKVSPERITKIWDDLCVKELRTSVSDQNFTSTHELLLSNSSQLRRSALAKHIVVGVRNAEEFSGAAYYNTLFRLCEYIDKNKLNVDVISMVTDIRKSPVIFFDYVTAAGDDYKTFKLKCNTSELTEFIVEKIPSNLHGLAALSVIAEDYDFEPIIELLEKELPKDTLTAESIEPFYELYKAVTTKKPIKAVADNHINTILAQIEDGSDGEIELFAMRLAKLSSYPGFPGKTQAIVAQTDGTLAKRIAERIEYYTSYGELLLGFVSWPQPMLKLVLRQLTLNSYGVSSMNISSVLKQFKVLCTSLEIEAEDFITRLNGWNVLAKDQITAENIPDVITDHEYFEYAIKIDNELTRHTIGVMISHLNTVDVDQWQESLRDEDSYLFNVTRWLLSGGQLKWVPDNAVTVYKEILIDVSRGEVTIDAEDGWDIFYERTHKGKLKATAKNIRDLFISEIAITAESFLALSDVLLKHADLSEKSADVARKILAPIATDESCQKFFIDNSDFFAALINKAGDDADDFKDIVRQKAMLPEASVGLSNFAKSIGIESIDESEAEESEHLG